MEIWIKDISTRNCYTRFGKVIPKKETKVDVEKFFGRDVLSAIKSDPLIKCIVHNAKDLETEKKAASKRELEVNIVIENEKERKKEIKKNIKKGKGVK